MFGDSRVIVDSVIVTVIPLNYSLTWRSSMLYKIKITQLVADLFESDANTSLAIPDVGETIQVDGNSYTVSSRVFSLDTTSSPPVMTVQIIVP